MASAYNTRFSAINIPLDSSGYIGAGIIGKMVIGKVGTSSKDGQLINCFVTTVSDPIQNVKRQYLVKRPGFATINTPSAGNIGSSLLVWTGRGNGTEVISAFGATNSTLYLGTTSLGAITGVSTGISETFIGASPTLIISSSDNTAWHVDSAAIDTALTFTGDTHTNTTVDNISSTTGLLVGQLLTGTGFAANTRIQSINSATAITLTVATTATNAGVTITRTMLGKIVDVDFPGNAGLTLAGTFAIIDGFACIMDTTGKVWASDLNTLTSWNPLSFDSTNAYPDKGIGCIRQKNFILAFGTESVQFFYNAGLTPFPFSKSIPMTTKVGAISAIAITQIADSIYWCGSTPQGGLSIFSYDGSISRISTPEIDGLLILAGASAISLTTIRFYGRSFVIINASNTTYVYCIEENCWFQMTSAVNLWYKCAGVSIGGTMVNYSISNALNSGKVYGMNPSLFVFTDDTNTYTATSKLPSYDHGTSARKFYSEVNLVCDREISSSPITLLYSDDDYQTWVNWGTLDLSDDRPKANRLGNSRKRAWAISHSANTPMRIEYLEGRVEVGAS